MGYKKIGVLFVFTFFRIAGYSQNTINNYKYVLLPPKFDFLSYDDQYGLNGMTYSLLEQKGFTVIWTNTTLPQAVATNRCAALIVEVTQRKAIFTTNLTLVLKDCFGNIIYKGKEGKSREKDFDVSYKAALNDAFVSLNAVPYKYDSTLLAQPSVQPSVQPQQPVATIAVAAQAPVSATHTITDAPGVLYAQPIPNGYQLIDTTPKKVMTLLKTSVQDCFLADPGGGAPTGIVFKNKEEWFFEYYKDGMLVSQKLPVIIEGEKRNK